MSPRPCEKCAAKLEIPLACNACGALFAPVPEPTPFEALGLEPAFALDARDLERRLLRFTRVMHPDYFAGKDAAQRALAERNTAQLNAAFEVLADPARRADWLVRRLGGPSEREQRDVPPDVLAEAIEWSESIDAARAAPADSNRRGEIDALERALEVQRHARLARVAALLAPLPERGAPALVDVRRELNVLRYVDRALADIQNLRVAQARAS